MSTPPGSPQEDLIPLASSFPVIDAKTPRARRRDALKEKADKRKRERENRARQAAEKRARQENIAVTANVSRSSRRSLKPKLPQEALGKSRAPLSKVNGPRSNARGPAPRVKKPQQPQATTAQEPQEQDGWQEQERAWKEKQVAWQEKDQKQQLMLENEREKSKNLEQKCATLCKSNEEFQGQLLQANTLVEKLKQEIAVQQQEISDQKQEISAHKQTQKELRNTILELKGNIRVFARVRPTVGQEEKCAQSAFTFPEDDPENKKLELVQAGNCSPYSFQFDRVFKPREGQQAVFEEVAQLVQSALDGYRVCIFAYGQTGSGKTYTMDGDLSDPTKRGVIPRSVDHIFAKIAAQDEWTYNLHASFLEIYNESVKDLCIPAEDAKPLEIRLNPKSGETFVPGLKETDVKTAADVQSLMRAASRSRSVAATAANEHSSRSHSVFTLTLVAEHKATGEKRRGMLHLIDLAGSERLNNSKAKGAQLKETQAINKSLSSLGDVIFALASKKKHVPFRNSKLTYLLQNSLGGNCKCLCFINLSPNQTSSGESLCSLRFGHKVNNCDIGTAKAVKMAGAGKK